MPIQANVTNNQITASVGETQIDVNVSGGVGPTGTSGAAATVTVGTVTTGAPGSSASVTNVGTSGAAVLNFTIPAGATGPQGPQGPAGSNATATTDASALVTGTLPDARLSSNIARTSDVTSAVAAVVNAAPASLDTLKELATALGNDASFSATVTNSLAAKAPINNPTFTGTVSGVTKSMVGLGNVDNTSDASKPVSTAQAAADSAVASTAASDATTKANAAQAYAVQRANHTGTQAAATITGLATVATSGSYNDLANKPTIPSAYTLPTASSSTLGGIKVGSGLSIDGAGVLSAAGGGGGGVELILQAHNLSDSNLTDGSDNTFIYTEIDANPYSAYDSTTGLFTVPTGKGGVYAFQISLNISGGYPLTSACNPGIEGSTSGRVFASLASFTVADGTLRFAGVVLANLIEGETVSVISYLGDSQNSGITWTPDNALSGFNAISFYKL